MKIVPSASVGCLRLALLLGATSAVSQLLAVQPAPAVVATDPYTAAVNAYVDAATKEMAVVRKEIDAAEKQGKKEAYTAAHAVFDKCDALVTHLKTASRGEFDPTKAEYERTRSTLQMKLKEARRAQAAVLTPQAPAPLPPAKH